MKNNMDNVSLLPKGFRWTYIVYIFGTIFVLLYGFLWVRPPIVFFTQSNAVSAACVQQMKVGFWMRYGNPLGRVYASFFVRKIEVLDNETVRLYGWFNNRLWEEGFHMGGENDCRL